MSTVSDSSSSITPLLLSGLVVLTFRHLREHDVALPPVAPLLELLGVVRSRSYEIASQIEDAIADVVRPVGRPPKSEPEADPDQVVDIVKSVRDYLIDHPGAVIPGVRRTYSDGFRRFIVELFEDQAVPIETFADATGVPHETIRGWLRAGPRESTDGAETQSSDNSSPVDADRGRIAHIIALWRAWSGNLLAFQKALAKEHAINAGLHTLREVLRIDGHRKTNARGSKSPPEAIRGTLERFFPGAQWIGDGKTLDITVGQTTHRFTWELVVDAHRAAHVGFDIRDAEDAEGVVNALDHGVATTGGTPCAVLLDNRPGNHTDEVRDKLAELGAIEMSSTLFRAQNKAPVEGAFGLFSQKMPPIRLDDSSERILARSLLWHVLFAYCAGRNQAPDKSGTTPAGAYAESETTEEEIAAARARLREIDERIRKRNDHEFRAFEPACLALLEDAFERLGLSDPEGRFIPAIAAYGIDAVTEAIAVFERVVARKHIDCPERYLLGIARKIADRNEHTAIYERLVDLRGLAGDFVLKRLVRADERRREDLEPDEYLHLTLEDALDSGRPTIHRVYFRRSFLTRLRQLDDERREAWCHRASMMIAVSYSLRQDERRQFLALLAQVAVPLKVS